MHDALRAVIALRAKAPVPQALLWLRSLSAQKFRAVTKCIEQIHVASEILWLKGLERASMSETLQSVILSLLDTPVTQLPLALQHFYSAKVCNGSHPPFQGDVIEEAYPRGAVVRRCVLGLQRRNLGPVEAAVVFFSWLKLGGFPVRLVLRPWDSKLLTSFKEFQEKVYKLSMKYKTSDTSIWFATQNNYPNVAIWVEVFSRQDKSWIAIDPYAAVIRLPSGTPMRQTLCDKGVMISSNLLYITEQIDLKFLKYEENRIVEDDLLFGDIPQVEPPKLQKEAVVVNEERVKRRRVNLIEAFETGEIHDKGFDIVPVEITSTQADENLSQISNHEAIGPPLAPYEQRVEMIRLRRAAKNVATKKVSPLKHKCKPSHTEPGWKLVPCGLVISVGESGFVADVSMRYCESWDVLVGARKTQNSIGLPPREGTAPGWLLDHIDELNAREARSFLLSPDLAACNRLDAISLQSAAQSSTQPFPTTIQGFRKSAAYVIDSVLKKTEVILVREPIMGLFRGKAIYPRSLVWPLKTASQWRAEGRDIETGMTPLRIVEKRTGGSRKRQAGLTDAGQQSISILKELLHSEISLEAEEPSADERIEYWAEFQTHPKSFSEHDRVHEMRGKVPVDKYGRTRCYRGPRRERVVPEGCTHIPDSYPGFVGPQILRDIPHGRAVVGRRWNHLSKFYDDVIDGWVVSESDYAGKVVPRCEETEDKIVRAFVNEAVKARRIRWKDLIKGCMREYQEQLEGSAINEKPWQDLVDTGRTGRVL